MSVDFQWHHETLDNDDQPTGTPIPLLPRGPSPAAQPRQPSRLTVAVLAGVLLMGLCTFGVVKVLSQRGLQAASADLIAAARTEASALALGDIELFQSLQAPATTEAPTLPSQRFTAEQERLSRMAAIDASPLRILDLTLRGDRAAIWVGYTTNGTTYARLQGYQQVGGRWLRTEVSERWWGEARTLQTRHFQFEYHEAEEEAVRYLARWAEALYANLNFGPRRAPTPLVIELSPFSRPPSTSFAWRYIWLPSPLLVGICPDRLRQPLPRAEVEGLSYSPGEGQEVLANAATSCEPTAAALSYQIAMILAADATSVNVRALELNWLIAEAAAQYEVEVLVPELVQAVSERALLHEVLHTGALSPLASLWPTPIVIAAQTECENELCRDLLGYGTTLRSILGFVPPIIVRSDVQLQQTLAEAKSLMAFAEEQMAAWGDGPPTKRFPLVVRFLEGLALPTPDDAIRFLFQEEVQDDMHMNRVAAVFYEEPQRFVEAWHVWLWERYR